MLARIERFDSDAGLLGSLLIHYKLFCSIGKDTRLKVNCCFLKLNSPVSLTTKHPRVSHQLANIFYCLCSLNCQIQLRETQVCKYRTQNTKLMLKDKLRFIKAELWGFPILQRLHKHSYIKMQQA